MTMAIAVDSNVLLRIIADDAKSPAQAGWTRKHQALQIHVNRRQNACEQLFAFAREQGVTLRTFNRKLAKQTRATLAS